jgi:PKD domain/Glucodextranase, domain B
MLQHDHFGRLRPHHHTSYAGLAFVLLVVGVTLFGLSWAAEAAPPAVNPQSGSIGLSGTVKGAAPGTAATITAPANGSHTSHIPVTVSGSCPAGTFVNIEKNNVFAGAASCSDSGTFTLQVDLFDGSNSLVARVSDALGQYGPDSTAVTVFYDAPSLALPAGTAGQQLFLDTSTTIVGGSPNQPIPRTVTIVGGVAPYAVSWSWGDDATSLMSEATPGPVAASHTYARPGLYTVIVRVTDSQGNSAYLQTVTVVNGPVAAFGGTNTSGAAALPGELLGAWPLYGIALVMVTFFWLGEWRGKRVLRRQELELAAGRIGA